MINTEITNNNTNGFKKLLKESISDILLTEYPEIYKIKLSLQISDGCMLIGPILIHLILPLTLVPTSGKKRATNNKILSSINIQSVLNKNSDGISKNADKTIIPMAKKNDCLCTK